MNMAEGKMRIEGVDAKSLAVLRSINTPTGQLLALLTAVLFALEHVADLNTVPWETARKAMSDSRRFVRELVVAGTRSLQPERLARLQAFDTTGLAARLPLAAQGLIKWLQRIVHRDGAPVLHRDGSMPASPAPDMKGAANVPRLSRAANVPRLSSVCVVTSANTDGLSELRMDSNTITILQRASDRLQTSWRPRRDLPIFTFDGCFWLGKRGCSFPATSKAHIFESTFSCLLGKTIRGQPACLCVVGPATVELLYGKSGFMDEVLQRMLLEAADTVDVGVTEIHGNVSCDLLSNYADAAPGARSSTSAVKDATELQKLLNSVLCEGHRLVTLKAPGRGDLHVLELDSSDSVGVSALQKWCSTTRQGSARLAVETLQRLVAGVHAKEGHIMMMCALTSTASDWESITALQTSQLSHDLTAPQAKDDDPLQTARTDISKLKKSELAKFRAIMPSLAIQAAVKAALLCLGKAIQNDWESVRSALCDPNLLRQMKEHGSQIVLPEAAWQRLLVLLQECAGLPIGAETDAKETQTCGCLLAQWALAVHGAGLVTFKRSVRALACVPSSTAGTHQRASAAPEKITACASTASAASTKSLETFAQARRMASLHRAKPATPTLKVKKPHFSAHTCWSADYSSLSREKSLERQTMTSEHSRKLRYTAWKSFVNVSQRDISEAELLRVSFTTLKRLLSLYGFDEDIVKCSRIELFWTEANWTRHEPFLPSTLSPYSRPVNTVASP
ncbi:hypothetical protein DIPPA_70052 [Diplonema papillatum]|nr:hypothetical protein DIPPA_70052 [Diplonema papillatum]